MSEFKNVSILIGAVTETDSLRTTVDTVLGICRHEDLAEIMICYPDRVTPECLAVINELTEMITGLVEGEVWYTVVSGDSPSLIASKNNLRLRELYNLNRLTENSTENFCEEIELISENIRELSQKLERFISSIDKAIFSNKVLPQHNIFK